jgi:hypothetical protein
VVLTTKKKAFFQLKIIFLNSAAEINTKIECYKKNLKLKNYFIILNEMQQGFLKKQYKKVDFDLATYN